MDSIVSSKETANVPFLGAALDFDGVVELYGKETPEEANTIRELITRRIIEQDIPMTFITGKDEEDVGKRIIDPFQEKFSRYGIWPKEKAFMVFSNMGSVMIDAGNKTTLERRDFTSEQRKIIASLEVARVMMDIYEIFGKVRQGITGAFNDTRYREEKTTILFKLDPADLLKHDGIGELVEKLQRMAGIQKDLSRFDLGQIFKAQLTEKDLADVPVSVTDGGIDLTPVGTGKRVSLERFANIHGLAVEDTARMGDCGTGSDYLLLAPKDDEWRGGVTNTPLDHNQLAILRQHHPDFGSPIEVEYHGSKSHTQFQRSIHWLKNLPLQTNQGVTVNSWAA